MNIFLLIYDRDAGRLERVDEYEQSQRARALDARLEAERAASREGRRKEIVLFEAESLDALKEMHGSYFYTVEELGKQLGDQLRRLAS